MVALSFEKLVASQQSLTLPSTTPTFLATPISSKMANK